MLCVSLGCCILYTIQYQVNMVMQLVIHAETLPDDVYQSVADEFNSKRGKYDVQKMNYVGHHDMLSVQLYIANMQHCGSLLAVLCATDSIIANQN